MFDLSFSLGSSTPTSLHHLAFTSDKSVTLFATGHLPHKKSTIPHNKFTRLRIPARRKLSHNIQSSDLGRWEVRCSDGASHLEGGQAAGTWDGRENRSQIGILGLSFSSVFDFGALVSGETTISDSATDTFATGDDRKYCGPPSSPHLLELKSG